MRVRHTPSPHAMLSLLEPAAICATLIILLLLAPAHCGPETGPGRSGSATADLGGRTWPPTDATAEAQPSDEFRQLREDALRFIKGKPLDDADLIYVTGADKNRLALAQSSRSWRAGDLSAGLNSPYTGKPAGLLHAAAAAANITVRAFIAFDDEDAVGGLNAANAPFKELYGYYPSDGSRELGGIWHGSKDGDTRIALAPWLAHRAYNGQYKWILYGDDDTLFLLPGVRALLPHLDHNLPLALSDNLWGPSPAGPWLHPSRAARRCLPCAFSPDYLPSLAQIHEMDTARDALLRARASRQKAFQPPPPAPPPFHPDMYYTAQPACPYCTAASACRDAALGPSASPAGSRSRHRRSGGDGSTAGSQGSASAPPNCTAAGAHGGAGIIFSVGLLRHVSLEAMKQCVHSYRELPGGDSLITRCLFYNFSIGYTDPGAFHFGRFAGAHLLFQGSDGGGVGIKKAKWLVSHDKCDVRCEWLLRNAVSVHLGARKYRSFDKAAQAAQAVVRGHMEALHMLVQRRQQGTQMQRMGQGSGGAASP